MQTATASPADRLERFGPSVMVMVGFDPAFDWRRPNIMPTLPATERRALIDTGSLHNAIDRDLARDLALPIIGQTTLAGIGGESVFPLCRVHIIIPGLPIGTERHMAVAALRSVKDGPSVLFGRSMLRDFRFFYDGTAGIVKLDPIVVVQSGQ